MRLHVNTLTESHTEVMAKQGKPAEPTTQGVQHATVALDRLTPHPRNYRRHSESQVARLGASLARFGQVRSIVCQEGADGRYLLVAGHGLTEAARANGYTELRADVIPATWTPTQIEGYLIADNETTRGADDDLVQLAAMLEEQRAAGEHLEALGYSDEELAALLNDLSNAELVSGEDGGDDEIPGLNAPDKPYENQYAVSVLCASEEEQERVYNRLTEMGYTCKVLVV